MDNKFFLPRGTSDILPEEVGIWQDLENKSRDLLKIYGYKEIRTPIFEETNLFVRSMGQTSDVVKKQMLNVASQKQKDSEEDNIASLSLRPEGTASVVRSYIQNSLDRKEQLSKLYYIGPMFRGERPQKGRLRQFYQIGVEVIGPNSCQPYLDAEVISLSIHLLKVLGVNDFKLELNTLGSPEDKQNFSSLLRDKLNKNVNDLCEDCQDRFKRNVCRVLDCKNRACQAVVNQLDLDNSYLSEESRKYFSQVCQALDNLSIKYEISKKLVRGLDYYTHTVFEISSSLLGSQNALGAGGRYNNLVKELGGPQADAIGFALGIERILLALSGKNKIVEPYFLDAFIISLDENTYKEAFQLLNVLRSHSLISDMSYRISSMKSQMRLADKLKARFVIILGENEIKKGIVTIKNMSEGTQHEEKKEDIKKIISRIKER